MKKYYKYIGIFVFFLVLFILSPISGDDWGNYLVGQEGIRHSLGVAVGLYFDWEGRFISRIFINILTYHKWLWNIINSLVITSTIYMGVKYIEKPKRIIFPLMILVVLLMNIYTFSQTVTWLAGNMTYLFVIPVILWYFYYLITNNDYNKYMTCVFLLINLFGTMFVEHMALVLIVGNILILGYKYIKYKKVDVRIIVYLIVSILSTLLMLLSPGSRYRITIENVEFNKLNIFEKVIHNIPSFIYYTFIVNYFLLVLMSYSNYLIIKEKVENKLLRVILILFMLILPLFTIIIYPISMFTITKLNVLIDSNNIFVICYWLLYLVISFLLLVFDNRKNFLIIFLFIIGVLANVFMMVSPTWGFRTSLFTYICLAIVSLNIINKYVKDSRFNHAIWSVVGGIGLFYLVFYVNIYQCQKNLVNSIEKQVDRGNHIIYVDMFPSFAPCNINPLNDYHLEKFKIYYGIEDKEVVLVDDKWIGLIFYEK